MLSDRVVRSSCAVLASTLVVGLAGCGTSPPAAAPASASSTTVSATTTDSPEELARWVTGFCGATAPLGAIMGAPPADQVDQTSIDTILGSLGQYYLDAGDLATTASAAVAALGQVPLDGAQGFQRRAAEELELTADQYVGLQLETTRVDTADDAAVTEYVQQVDATEPVTLYVVHRLVAAVPDLEAAIFADPTCGLYVVDLPTP